MTEEVFTLLRHHHWFSTTARCGQNVLWLFISAFRPLMITQRLVWFSPQLPPSLLSCRFFSNFYPTSWMLDLRRPVIAFMAALGAWTRSAGGGNSPNLCCEKAATPADRTMPTQPLKKHSVTALEPFNPFSFLLHPWYLSLDNIQWIFQQYLSMLQLSVQLQRPLSFIITVFVTFDSLQTRF